MRAARADFVQLLRAQVGSDADVDSAALTFGELVTNAMRHAPPGEVEVLLRWNGPTATLCVIDSGRGFTPNPRLPDAGSPGGRGLFIVAAVAGPVRVQTGPAGCSVSVELPFVRRR